MSEEFLFVSHFVVLSTFKVNRKENIKYMINVKYFTTEVSTVCKCVYVFLCVRYNE